MKERNKLIPIFFVAFRTRPEGEITVIYRDGEEHHFDSNEAAQSYFDELVQNKSYAKVDIEIIRLWKIQTL